MKDLPHVIDEPVKGFDIADLFLSRTDERGVIQSGNTTFKRLSEYEWADLIGAPHKLVRHPDMPKAAFHLLWNNLKENRPFGAYVKNRSGTGRYYWVFAVMVPIGDGYLSVRLKPTSSCFDAVQELYVRMLKAERAGGSIEEGVAMISDAVRAMEFRDYTAFMGYALGAEIAARATALGREVDPSVSEFEEMGELLVQLSKEVEQVKLLFDGISSSPINLNILGSRLTTGREAMQVVAQNYEFLSMKLLESINALAGRLEVLLDKAFTGRMGYCASLLYHEAVEEYAANEPNRKTRGHAAELVILNSALQSFRQLAQDGCVEIAKEVDQFVKLTARLRQMLSGLAVTRVVCRIEAAGVNEDTSSIDEISMRLTRFQDELGVSLDRIGNACTGLSRCIPCAVGEDKVQTAA